jgi:hypothetical protein
VAVCQGEEMSKFEDGWLDEKQDEAAQDRALRLVRRLLEKVEVQLDQAEVKGTVGDYIKLLQLQKELEERRVKRIEVTWVDVV